MLQLTPEHTQRILSHPSFRELASERAKLRWSLSVITLVLFFGFIALISLPFTISRSTAIFSH